MERTLHRPSHITPHMRRSLLQPTDFAEGCPEYYGREMASFQARSSLLVQQQYAIRGLCSTNGRQINGIPEVRKRNIVLWHAK